MKKVSILLIDIFLQFCGHSKAYTTSNKAEKAGSQEDTILREEFKTVFGTYIIDNNNENNQVKASKVFFRSNYKVTFSSVTDFDKVSDSPCMLTIENANKKFTDTLDFKASVFVTSLNADIDIFNDTAFICWVSGNPVKQIPSTIWLKIINLRNNKVEYFNKIHMQEWGVERISLIYNPFKQVIHFAYNDFSQPNSTNLYLSSLNAFTINSSGTQLYTQSILNQDKTEKRYPRFIRSGNSIFLYHTSGDNWGFFAHTGIQGIGISRIDKYNNPAEYKILADSNTINEEILLHNDTIFYQHVIGKNNGDYEIKRIKIANVPLAK